MAPARTDTVERRWPEPELWTEEVFSKIFRAMVNVRTHHRVKRLWIEWRRPRCQQALFSNMHGI